MEASRFYKVGGLSLAASGLLFLLKAVADAVAGPPPEVGILEWATSSRAALATATEIYFFAVMCLVPGVIALYRSLADEHPMTAVTGCGMIAVLIPVMIVLDVVIGRLVFPVYGLTISDPLTAKLAIGLYYGGLHAVDLVFGFALVVLSAAMRRSAYGTGIAALGIAAAVADFVAGYPWLLPPIALLLARALAAAWLVGVGVTLHGYRRVPSNAAAPSGPEAFA